jgi:hypothetical protein
VPPPAGNVISLYSRRSPGGLPIPLEQLGAAVRELNDLRGCVEQIARDPRWSALEWRAACMPVMLRVPRIRQSLAQLARIRASQWPDTDWAVRLCAARDDVERRLLDVSMSMSALACKETSTADTVADFSSDGIKLAEAVDELSSLIVSRYPAAADDV